MAHKNIFLVMHAFENFISNGFISKEQLTFIWKFPEFVFELRKFYLFLFYLKEDRVYMN